MQNLRSKALDSNKRAKKKKTNLINLCKKGEQEASIQLY